MKRLAPAALAVALLAGGWLALPAPAAPDGEAVYDLRGPGPKVGQVIVESYTMAQTDGQVTYTMGDQSRSGTYRIDETKSKRRKIQAVEGREVTRYTETIAADQRKVVITVGGQERKQELVSPLVGKTVTWQKSDGKWTASLGDGELTAAEKAALAELVPWQNEDPAYPSDPVGVGFAWKMSADDLRRAWNVPPNVTVEQADCEFDRVEDVDGVRCAVITMAVKMKAPAASGATTLTLKATEFRSLATGLVLRVTADGDFHSVSKQQTPNGELTMEMKAPMTIVASEKPAAE